MVPGVTGIYHDDGIYVCTAKALAQGQGYRLINLPDSPLQTKYPIIYPALLAVLWKIWPVFPYFLINIHSILSLARNFSLAGKPWPEIEPTDSGIEFSYRVPWKIP